MTAESPVRPSLTTDTLSMAGWRIHASTHRISKGEKSVKLEPRTMAVLLYLAERAGEAVTREQLEEDVWRGMVVGYDALSIAITKLRKAFDDDPKHPQIIETIPKVGYRLLADIRHSSADTESAVDVQELEALGRQTALRKRKRLAPGLVSGGAGLMALLTLVAIVAWFKPWAPSDVPTSMEQRELPLPDKPSIAVLPFDNLTGDPKQEYFSDGMTDDLITDLSKVSGLFVIARKSAFAYKDESPDVRRVARELGVRYILEGSVRRAGDRVRINAQLVDASTGRHLWAERYDGSMTDVFALQDKVTQKIVTALAVQLTAGEAEQVTRKETNNVAAYDAFLQGWTHYVQDTPEGFAKATPLFEKAVALDPNYGRAYAALAAVHYVGWTRGWYGRGGHYSEAVRRAYEYLQKALQNPTPLAHAVASLSATNNARHEQSIVEAERAIALDANDPAGYVQMALALTMTGRPEEAIAFVEKAMRLNPHYPPTYLWVLGLAHFGMEQFDEAAALLERAYKRSPEIVGAVLASTYGHLGRKQDARAVLEILKQRRQQRAPAYPLTVRSIMAWWFPFAHPEDAKRFADGLRKAGLK